MASLPKDQAFLPEEYLPNLTLPSLGYEQLGVQQVNIMCEDEEKFGSSGNGACDGHVTGSPGQGGVVVPSPVTAVMTDANNP